MSKVKKIILLVLASFLLLFCVIIGVILWAVSAVWDEKPFSEKMVVPQQDELFLISMKTTPFINSLKNANDESAPVETLVFNEKEMNAFFKLARQSQAQGLGKKELEKNHIAFANGYFKDGVFHISLSFDSQVNTWFGKYINVKIELVPEVSEKEEKLKIISCTVGSLSFPSESIERKINESLVMAEKVDKRYAIARAAIRKIYVKDNKLHIEYSPYFLRTLMKKELGMDPMLLF
jgi:hypothetical protein